MSGSNATIKMFMNSPLLSSHIFDDEMDREGRFDSLEDELSSNTDKESEEQVENHQKMERLKREIRKLEEDMNNSKRNLARLNEEIDVLERKHMKRDDFVVRDHIYTVSKTNNSNMDEQWACDFVHSVFFILQCVFGDNLSMFLGNIHDRKSGKKPAQEFMMQSTKAGGYATFQELLKIVLEVFGVNTDGISLKGYGFYQKFPRNCEGKINLQLGKFDQRTAKFTAYADAYRRLGSHDFGNRTGPNACVKQLCEYYGKCGQNTKQLIHEQLARRLNGEVPDHSLSNFGVLVAMMHEYHVDLDIQESLNIGIGKMDKRKFEATLATHFLRTTSAVNRIRLVHAATDLKKRKHEGVQEVDVVGKLFRYDLLPLFLVAMMRMFFNIDEDSNSPHKKQKVTMKVFQYERYDQNIGKDAKKKLTKKKSKGTWISRENRQIY